MLRLTYINQQQESEMKKQLMLTMSLFIAFILVSGCSNGMQEKQAVSADGLNSEYKEYDNNLVAYLHPSDKEKEAEMLKDMKENSFQLFSKNKAVSCSGNVVIEAFKDNKVMYSKKEKCSSFIDIVYKPKAYSGINYFSVVLMLNDINNKHGGDYYIYYEKMSAKNFSTADGSTSIQVPEIQELSRSKKFTENKEKKYVIDYEDFTIKIQFLD